MKQSDIDNFKIDRTKWSKGPWDSEPDRIDFEHAGFPCLMLRSQSGGNWCGYVGLPPTHSAYKKSYDDIDVDVHGGLTYGSECDENHICHLAEEDDKRWWVGFDCGHYNDFMPAFSMRMKQFGGYDFGINGIYKDVDYVRHETKQLAEQLSEMK